MKKAAITIVKKGGVNVKNTKRNFFRLECEQIFSYKVYPRNNHATPLAISGQNYSTEKECQGTMRRLQQYIVEGKIQISDERYVKIQRTENKSYTFSIFINNNECLLKSNKQYKSKRSCQEAIERIFETIRKGE